MSASVASGMQDHTKLKVWRKALELSVDLDQALARMPRGAPPKLRDQCLRAAASISANIVEGCGFATRKEFARYLAIAINSSKETEHHLLRLFRAKVIDAAMYSDFEERVIEVRRMLYGLRKRVLEKDDE